MSRRRLLPVLAAGAALLALLLGGTASSYSPAPVSTWVVSGGIPAAGATVNSVAVSGNTAYLGGDFAYIGPETGSFVGADATTGSLASPWPVVGGNVYAVAPDGSNGFFIGGFFNSVGTKHADNLAHISADGTLDTNWTGSTNGTVYAIAVSNDTVFAGGAFSTAGGASHVNLAAFDKASGAVVSSFTANATGGTNPFVAALRLSPAGLNQKLYVGGRFLSLAESTRSNIGAVFTSGGIDGFAPTVNNVVYALALNGDGSIVYAGGAFTAVTVGPNTLVRTSVAAFSPGGVLQPWDPEADGQVYALDVSGTTVYAGGGFGNIGGAPRRGLAALNASGIPQAGQAKSWTPDVNGQVYAVSAPGAGGTVYVGGRFDTVNFATGRENLAAIDATTGTATSFAPVVGGEVDALAVSGPNVGFGGEFRAAGTGSNQPRHRSNLAAIDLTTGQPTSWNPVANNTVQVVAVFGSRVYAGGDFTSVGLTPTTRHRLASFDLQGNVTSWDPGVHNGTVYALAFANLPAGGTTVYAGGTFNGATAVSNPAVARNRAAAFDATGAGNLRNWDPNANSDVYAIDVVGSTAYLGGAFTAMRTVARNRLAAVPSDPNITGTWGPNVWNPNVNAAVLTLAHAGSLEYAGGPFTMVNGTTPRGGAAAFDTTTATATSWNPQVLRDAVTTGTVFSLVPSGPYMYLSGVFRSVGGPWTGPGPSCVAPCFFTPAVAAVSLATAAPNTTWQPGADDLISSIAMSSQGLVMGGQFTTLGFPPPGTLPVNADEPGATYHGGFAVVRALPEAPTNVIANLGGSSATVSFAAPVVTGGSPITSYTLTATPGPIVMNDVTSGVIVPNLAAGSGYTFSVTATTSGGTGDAGVSNTVHTLSGTPTGVTAAPDDGRAVVSFTATPGNDPVTYTVTASSGQTATGTSSPITVYGLPNDVPVSFRVKATTVAGDGPTSDPSDQVTPVEGGRTHPTPPAPIPRTLTPDPPTAGPRPPAPAH